MVAGAEEHVTGMVTVAPAVWTFTNPLRRSLVLSQGLRLGLAAGIGSVYGSIPSRVLGLGDRDGSSAYLSEYLHWVTRRQFRSTQDDLDYENTIRETTVPNLMIWGSRDRNMAPWNNFNWVTSLLNPQVTRVMVVSPDNGFPYEGDHFSVIYGREAASVVWPRIVEWVNNTGGTR